MPFFFPTEKCRCGNIRRLYISSHKHSPVVTDSIGVPLKLTLPSLESNVEPVFTACYCHVSQCLILSNWVMTTTLQSDTSTARSVHSVASFTQRNWVKPTCTTEHIAGDTSESNKSNRRYQTHTHKDTHACRNAHAVRYRASVGTSQIPQGGFHDSMVGVVSSQQDGSELIQTFLCVCVVVASALVSAIIVLVHWLHLWA